MKRTRIVFFAAFCMAGLGSAGVAQTADTLATAVPSGYTSCAVDGGKCAATGTWTGYYGASGKFAQIKGSGEFVCLPGNLGVADPAQGVQKTCYVSSANLAVPTKAAAQAADTLATAVPSGYTSCAVDGGKCAASGAWTGYYGANGKFAQIKGTGEFVCLPGNLGVADPAQGVQKTCYVSSANLAVAAKTTTPTTTATTTTQATPPAPKPAAGGTVYRLPNTAQRGQSCTWAAAEYCFMLRDRLYPYVDGLSNSMGPGTKDVSNGKIITTMIQNYKKEIGNMPPDVYSLHQSNPAVPDVGMVHCRNNINTFNMFIKGFTQFAPSAKFTPPAAPLTVTLTKDSCAAGFTATGAGLPTRPPNP